MDHTEMGDPEARRPRDQHHTPLRVRVVTPAEAAEATSAAPAGTRSPKRNTPPADVAWRRDRDRRVPTDDDDAHSAQLGEILDALRSRVQQRTGLARVASRRSVSSRDSSDHTSLRLSPGKHAYVTEHDDYGAVTDDSASVADTHTTYDHSCDETAGTPRPPRTQSRIHWDASPKTSVLRTSSTSPRGSTLDQKSSDSDSADTSSSSRPRSGIYRLTKSERLSLSGTQGSTRRRASFRPGNMSRTDSPRNKYNRSTCDDDSSSTDVQHDDDSPDPSESRYVFRHRPNRTRFGHPVPRRQDRRDAADDDEVDEDHESDDDDVAQGRAPLFGLDEDTRKRIVTGATIGAGIMLSFLALTSELEEDRGSSQGRRRRRACTSRRITGVCRDDSDKDGKPLKGLVKFAGKLASGVASKLRVNEEDARRELEDIKYR